MKRVLVSAVLSVIMMISGCAESSALLAGAGAAMRTDIFQEISNPGPVPAEYADVRLVFFLKTHKPQISSANDLHGTAEYRVLVNLDGQVIQLQGSPADEKIAQTALPDPEAGEGVRYRFTSILRVKAGTHKLDIAIPGDGIRKVREINLLEGSSNSLVLEPVYRSIPRKQRPGFYGLTSFSQGLSTFRMILNGTPL